MSDYNFLNYLTDKMIVQPAHNIKTCLQNTTPIGRMLTFGEGYKNALKNSYITMKDEINGLLNNADEVRGNLPRKEYMTNSDILIYRMWGFEKKETTSPHLNVYQELYPKK